MTIENLINQYQRFLRWRISTLLKQDRKILNCKELGFSRYICVAWDLFNFFSSVLMNPFGFIISNLSSLIEYRQLEENKKSKKKKVVDLNSLPPSIRKKLEKADDELSKEAANLSVKLKKTAEVRLLKIKLDRRMKALCFLLLIQVLSWLSVIA